MATSRAKIGKNSIPKGGFSVKAGERLEKYRAFLKKYAIMNGTLKSTGR